MSPPMIATTTSSFSTADSPAHRLLLDAGCEVRVNPHGRKLTEDESVAVLRGAHGVIAGTSPLNQKVLDEAPDLAVISRVGVGLDSVDLEAVHQRGIDLFVTADAVRAPVAELTVGLMLAVLRAIPETDRRMRAGEWRQHTGRLLGERTVGIVGFGGIGRTVAQLLRGFGCRILAHDAAGIPDAEAAELGVEVGSLAEVLSESDVVTVHVPLVPGTRNLIGGNELSAMPTDSILVNTARGGIVDEDALLEALQDGHLAGAALDGFGQEPYDGPLLGLDQVVVTAHIGSAAREARDRMELEAVERLLSALRRRGVL